MQNLRVWLNTEGQFEILDENNAQLGHFELVEGFWSYRYYLLKNHLTEAADIEKARQFVLDAIQIDNEVLNFYN